MFSFMDSEIIKFDNGLLCVRVQLYMSDKSTVLMLSTDKLKTAADKRKYNPYTGIFNSSCDLGTHAFLRVGYITTFQSQFYDSHVRISR